MRDSIENLLEVKENTAYIFVSNSVNQSCVEENNAVKVDFFFWKPHCTAESTLLGTDRREIGL